MQITLDNLYDLAKVTGVVISALWLFLLKMWYRLARSERECRENERILMEKQNEIWKKLSEVKSKTCRHGCTVDDIIDNWPDRRSGDERRRKINLRFIHQNDDRRSGEDRRTDIEY